MRANATSMQDRRKPMPKRLGGKKVGRLFVGSCLSHMGQHPAMPSLLEFKFERRLSVSEFEAAKAYLTSFFKLSTTIGFVDSQREHGRVFAYVFSNPERARAACKRICMDLSGPQI